MADINFNDNVNIYDAIPSTTYPVLDRVYTSAFLVSHPTALIGNIVANSTGIKFEWKYPVSDNKFYKAAVGYQIQVFEGSLTESKISIATPTIIEYIQNFNDSDHTGLPEYDENDISTQYINLSTPQIGEQVVENGTFSVGHTYTARIRTLLFSELGDGQTDGAYFKYTLWSYVVFRINNNPTADTLRINGSNAEFNVLVSKRSNINLSFSYRDTDGPSYKYRIQVSDDLAFDTGNIIWDTGILSGGKFSGNRDFDIVFCGDYSLLEYDTPYYWRVYVEDGLSSGLWSYIDGSETQINYGRFSIAEKPVVTYFNIKDSSIGSLFVDYLFKSGNFSAGAIDIEWGFSSTQSGQKAYSLELKSGYGTEDVKTIRSFGKTLGESTSLSISDFPTTFPTYVDGLYLVLTVFGEYERSDEYYAILNTYEKPTALDFKTDGIFENKVVIETAPTFSWKFSNQLRQQASYLITVSTDADDFDPPVWNYGADSAVNSVVYAGDPLAHGKYYIRLYVSDENSTSDAIISYFVFNQKPNIPVLVALEESYSTDTIDIEWTENGNPDPDGDAVHYYLEYTNTLTSNTGWKFLAGPFSGDGTYTWDITKAPSGTDYGVRIIAIDEYSQSEPDTSDVFTIEPHLPVSPIIIYPTNGIIFSSSVFVEWIESIPASIDGYAIHYVVDLTLDEGTTWNTVGIYGQGNTKAEIDVSSFDNSINCGIRITAVDSRGIVGTAVQSPLFEIRNSVEMRDFEMVGNKMYAGSIDGKLYALKEEIWEVDEDFDFAVYDFQKLDNGVSIVELKDGKLRVNCPSGTSCIFKNV